MLPTALTQYRNSLVFIVITPINTSSEVGAEAGATICKCGIRAGARPVPDAMRCDGKCGIYSCTFPAVPTIVGLVGVNPTRSRRMQVARAGLEAKQ